MIAVLEVIWIFDKFIHPNNWKMVACIQPDCQFFFRINSKNRWQPALKIEREPHHAFLKHDSFLECSLPFELTDYDVQASLSDRGIVGQLHRSLASAIYDEVKANAAINIDDKKAIGVALVGSKRL